MLILLRHGQTAANAAGLLLGREDPPLTELGRRQARALAQLPGVAGARRVVTSPLRRSMETAEQLVAARVGGGRAATQVDLDDRWIEVNYGMYESMPLSQVPSSLWATWRSDPSWAPEGGESLTEVGLRVRSACEDLAAEATDGDVVVVSHVSPIKAAVAWALGVGDQVVWRMFLDVAAACRISIGPLGPTLRSFNETHHRPVA
jgi:broad specificity phosphatase PhoE